MRCHYTIFVLYSRWYMYYYERKADYIFDLGECAEYVEWLGIRNFFTLQYYTIKVQTESIQNQEVAFKNYSKHFFRCLLIFAYKCLMGILFKYCFVEVIKHVILEILVKNIFNEWIHKFRDKLYNQYKILFCSDLKSRLWTSLIVYILKVRLTYF